MEEHWERIEATTLVVRKDQFEALLADHVAALLTLLACLVLVLTFDLLLVWVLQCSATSRHRRLRGEDVERKPLRASNGAGVELELDPARGLGAGESDRRRFVVRAEGHGRREQD